MDNDLKAEFNRKFLDLLRDYDRAVAKGDTVEAKRLRNEIRRLFGALLRRL